jgi:hypothetical protein
MKKLLMYLVPVALMAAHASAAPPSGWAGIVAQDLGAATAASDDAHLVLVQYRRGGGAQVNRANVNRASVNRSSFNSANFQRDVSVNRNVNVNRNVTVNRGYYAGGSYGPNWGGDAAGVAVGAGVTAMATSAAAASSAYYPPPPPYPFYPNSYGY